jgi:adenine-specific DNA-methyltransferase
MRYQNESKDKENGVVYTPARMAKYLADEIAKYWKQTDGQKDITILDPAVGEGELLNAMINKATNFEKKITAVGYETDKNVADKTKETLKKKFPDINIEIRCEDFLDAVEEGTVGLFDFVIANPPYVRTQILGSEKAQRIAEKLKLKGRVDIYYAFLVETQKVLKRNGVSGYITSNKFMTIKAGDSVRKYMLQNYLMHQITDLGDTKLFSASVLPCIMIFSLGKTDSPSIVKFTSVYEEHEDKYYKDIKDIFDAIYEDGYYRIPDGRVYQIQQGRLTNSSRDGLWTLASKENETWLRSVQSNTWMTFSEIGKIRVGIKTTADNVFIGDNWSGDRADLEWLRPLITHRNAGQIIGNNKDQWKVLYTHTVRDGKKVAYDLDEYPKTKKYLMQYYDQLSGRSYVLKAHRNWYEIWVPQNPAAWEHRKIVFRDISEKPQFWIDETGAIVNGDCYWIDINSNVPEEVIYLALAVANSPFIEKFYDIKFNTKLYSGKRRYQTQYVEQFPIPYYSTDLASKAISLVKKIIAGEPGASSYKVTIDNLVNKMFSL